MVTTLTLYPLYIVLRVVFMLMMAFSFVMIGVDLLSNLIGFVIDFHWSKAVQASYLHKVGQHPTLTSLDGQATSV